MRGRFVYAILLGVVPMISTGCGPIEYIATVPLDAAGAISRAKQVDADKFAPYEITAAEQYVHKSRELAGYARFHSAVTFGSKAAESARRAEKLALEKAALPEEKSEMPAPAPTLAPALPSSAADPANNATDVHTTERAGKVIIIPPQGDK